VQIRHMKFGTWYLVSETNRWLQVPDGVFMPIRRLQFVSADRYMTRRGRPDPHGDFIRLLDGNGDAHFYKPIHVRGEWESASADREAELDRMRESAAAVRAVTRDSMQRAEELVADAARIGVKVHPVPIHSGPGRPVTGHSYQVSEADFRKLIAGRVHP
jgi:hypothetical protein